MQVRALAPECARHLNSLLRGFAGNTATVGADARDTGLHIRLCSTGVHPHTERRHLLPRRHRSETLQGFLRRCARVATFWLGRELSPTCLRLPPACRRFNEEVEFLGYDVQLAAFGGKAPAGAHSFPFSIKLPSVLTAPSMEVRYLVPFGTRSSQLFECSCRGDRGDGDGGGAVYLDVRRRVLCFRVLSSATENVASNHLFRRVRRHT